MIVYGQLLYCLAQEFKEGRIFQGLVIKIALCVEVRLPAGPCGKDTGRQNKIRGNIAVVLKVCSAKF